MMALKPTVSPKKDGSFDYPKPLGLHGRSRLHVLNSKGEAYCNGETYPQPKKIHATLGVCGYCRDIADKLPKKKAAKDED